ncbi:MAG: outer membrane beta-barrel protein, partial [Chlorobi bacterium]|nr:outer membrane beta-barrel protein [Chlorobiota bacterium]
MTSLHIRVTLSLIIALIASSFQSTAQETALSNNRTWYGVFGNAGTNLHSAFFTGFEGTARCGTFTDGSGFGYSGGFLVQFPLGPQLALVTRLGFSSLAGSLEAYDSFQSALPPDYSQVIDVTSRHTLETPLPLISLDINARLEPLPIPLAFSFGPAVGIYLNRSFSQNEEIISPPNLTFGTDKNVTGTIPGSTGLAINLTGGLEYDIPLSANWMLTPEIRASVPLTPVAPDMDWRVYTIRGGLQLKFAAPQPVQPTAPKPPPPPPPPPPSTLPQLDIALVVKGINADGMESDLVEIIVEETESS